MLKSLYAVIVLVCLKPTFSQVPFGGGNLLSIDTSQIQIESNEDLAKKFFKSYGYTTRLNLTDEEFSAALRDFRQHNKLSTHSILTGSLTSDDMTVIKSARCSMPDKFDKFTDPSRPLVDLKVHLGNKVSNALQTEWKAAAISKRQIAEETTDPTRFQCQNTKDPKTGKKKRAFTWCLDACIENEFCDIQGMRQTIAKAMTFWESITHLRFAEVRCPGGTGFWADDCGDRSVCDNADFKISFAELDGPSRDLTLACAITKPGDGIIHEVCNTHPGYAFLDSKEGLCPDGSSRWVLETDSCQATDCQQWSFYREVVHVVGHLLGIEDCGSGVMGNAYECDGNITTYSCIEDQIATNCPHYNKYLLPNLSSVEAVDLCFLVDITGSMESCIEGVKQSIREVVDLLTNTIDRDNPLIDTLRLSFVGYRDFLDDNQFEVLSFTPNVSKFLDFLNDVQALGGGDDPEDVFGGLERVTERNWTEKAVRVLFHMADYPCHHWRCGKNTGVDPLNRTAEDLFKPLREQKVIYNFGEINRETRPMIKWFQEIYGEEISVFNLGFACHGGVEDDEIYSEEYSFWGGARAGPAGSVAELSPKKVVGDAYLGAVLKSISKTVSD